MIQDSLVLLSIMLIIIPNDVTRIIGASLGICIAIYCEVARAKSLREWRAQWICVLEKNARLYSKSVELQLQLERRKLKLLEKQNEGRTLL
jgi:hypothetical protein